MLINLKKAILSDIPILLEIEKSVAGTNIYSPELDKHEWINEFKTNVIYLIEKNGLIVGNVSYEKKSKDYVYISGLVIGRRFQGQGIAREALSQILKELKNTRRIDIVTHPDNKIALHLYQSLGFVIESRKENYYGDGEPRLVLVLQNK